MKQVFILLAVICLWKQPVSAQTFDFIPGGTVIFEDRFEQDPVGDLPARWSTSSGGEVVVLDGFDGKWFRIKGNMAVNPELKKKLPEDCTIEFDLVIKKESCPVLLGLTPISDVSAGNIYYKKIFVAVQHMTGYPDIVFGKDVQDLGSTSQFSVAGSIDRVMRVSISVNKTRFRVYLDETKVVDLPKVMVPDYRNNFFIAGGELCNSPEGIYISNFRIAAGQADARRLLIKQLYEQGYVVTTDMNINPQTNTVTQESIPLLDTLGQALVNDPTLNIQLNGMETAALVDPPGVNGSNPPDVQAPVFSEEMVKMKVEKMKSYITQKFNVSVDRILIGMMSKAKAKVEQVKKSAMGSKLSGFLTEIIKR